MTGPDDANVPAAAENASAPEAPVKSAEQAERKLRWSVRLGVLVLRTLALTWRMRAHDDEPLHALRRADRRVIFALWHGELLPLLWQHRGEKVAIVISEHRDGEIVA